jgi:hypothetical protein
VAAILSTKTASAAIVQLSEDAFMAGAGLITFSEVPLGTENPVFAPSDYGGDATAPTVSTGGFFTGFSLSADASADCPGAAATACLSGAADSPLSLDPDAPAVRTANDGATNVTDLAESPVLSGTPIFNGPIALLFSEDQTGVGFVGGGFNAVGSTAITALARDGAILGSVVNTSAVGQGDPFEFLGLVTADGEPGIAGVFLDLVGAEPAGFGVDNIRFGQAGDIMLPPEVVEPPVGVIPVPAALPMLAAVIGALGVAGARRRR